MIGRVVLAFPHVSLKIFHKMQSQPAGPEFILENKAKVAEANVRKSLTLFIKNLNGGIFSELVVKILQHTLLCHSLSCKFI